MPWLLAVIFGGAGLTLLDQLHVHSSVLAYPASDVRIAGQSWWVGPQFLVAAALILAAARVVASRSPRPVTGRAVLQSAAWFVGAYGASALFAHHPRVLAILLGLTWLDRVALKPERWSLIALSVPVAVAGVVYEGALAGSGAFAYRHPDFFHVPFWLPGLYLHGALLAVAVARALGARGLPAPTAASPASA